MSKYILERDAIKFVISFLGYILLVFLVALAFPNSFVHYVLDAGILVSCKSYVPGKSVVGNAAHDGIADDIDNDGIPDKNDIDIDGDGKDNAHDSDDDGDGIPDTEDDHPRGDDSYCIGSACRFYDEGSQ